MMSSHQSSPFATDCHCGDKKMSCPDILDNEWDKTMFETGVGNKDIFGVELIHFFLWDVDIIP